VLQGSWWEPADRDKDGYRNYYVSFRVLGTVSDGPERALLTPGLPVPGASYVVLNDNDTWAYCKIGPVDIRRPTTVPEGDPALQWILKYFFSNKPDEKRCKDLQIDDPLLTPDRLSGDSSKYQEEQQFDRFGVPLRNSAFEQLRGPKVEFDKNRTTITVEQNRAELELDLFSPMVDTVNDGDLWGLPRRCIKLSRAPWEVKWYGQCFRYFTRKFEFETNAQIDPVTGAVTSGFDRRLADEGNKMLYGHWEQSSGLYVIDNVPGTGKPPDPKNPSHFIRARDRQGEIGSIPLNGQGLPAYSSVAGYGRPDSFICIMSNTGTALTDETAWVPLVGQLPPFPWEETIVYQYGDIVFGPSGGVFICTAPASMDIPNGSTDWLSIAVSNGGTYNPATPYTPGTFVDAPRQKFRTGQGILYIEYYGESNFLLLGIPTVLG
jgi:hypothetical protein